jgi:hypothetical protein
VDVRDGKVDIRSHPAIPGDTILVVKQGGDVQEFHGADDKELSGLIRDAITLRP